MDIIDVSPDDLVLPGGCLGRAVLYENYAWTIPQTALTDSPAGTHPGIKVMHPGSRDRLRRVLAAGERCERCHGTGRITGRVTWPDADCERCNGTGYTRQPHDLGHFIDAEIAGRITPLAAAGLMWASALRVEAGLNPVLGLFGTRFNYGVGPAYVQRNAHGKTIMFLATQAGSDGWLVRDPDTRALLASGSERGLKGVEAADTSALFAGFALLNDDHILLPLPDRIARLRLEG